MRLRLEGASAAAPSPCTIRAPIRTPPSWARPPATLASVNTETPARNTSLRPNRSPARDARSMKPPKAMRYPSTTHCWSVTDRPRSAFMSGSATLTIDESRIVIACVTAAISRTSPSGTCGLRPGGVAGGVGTAVISGS
jgi:hypothetical protein